MRSWQRKPPKGRSYPVRPSFIEAAIADAGLTLPVELARIDISKEAAFSARYDPPGSYPEGERFALLCPSVPSNQANPVRSAFEAEGLPRLIEWAKSIEKLDSHSPIRREPQVFRWTYPRFEG